MSTVINIVVIFITSALVAAAPDESDLIQWPETGCDHYTRNPQHPAPPLVEAMWIGWVSSKEECERMCSDRTDCGGYATYRRGEHTCWLYNINDRIIDTYLGTDTWRMYYSEAQWYSKACDPALVGSEDRGCTDDYTVRRLGVLIKSKWLLASTTHMSSRVTPEQCQQWCSLHPGCRSVEYTKESVGAVRACFLYTASIRDLPKHDVVINRDPNRYTVTYDRSSC